MEKQQREKEKEEEEEKEEEGEEEEDSEGLTRATGKKCSEADAALRQRINDEPG